MVSTAGETEQIIGYTFGGNWRSELQKLSEVHDEITVDTGNKEGKALAN